MDGHFVSRGFIESPVFSKKWHSYKLTDKELLSLQLLLIDNPKAGSVIPGTGKLRKLRYSFGQKGKRGGLRILYVDFERHGRIYLVDLFSKNEKEDLAIEEREIIRKRLAFIESTLFGGK